LHVTKAETDILKSISR